jgi:prophage regulatory protein
MHTTSNTRLAHDGPVLRDRFIDIRTVCRDITRCRSGVYALIKAGEFPKPRKLGARRVGWLQSEVEAWITSRKAA